MPEVNVPLLRKAVEWAEQSHTRMQARRNKLAEILDQEWWKEMPTDLVMEADDEYEWDQDHWTKTVVSDDGVDCGTACCIAGYVAILVDPDFAVGRNADGESVDSATAANIAMEALGISDRAAGQLFCSENDIVDVREIAERIAGERL